MTAAELPDDIQPPVARLIRQGHRRRAWRTGLVAAAAAVAVVAAAGIPATVHALRGGLTQPGGPGALGGLFGTRLPASPAGPAAAQLARFRWSTLPPSPLGTRDTPIVAWTGRELLEFGGARNGTAGNGAAFNPATGRWHSIASPGRRNIGFTTTVSVWTGRQLFVSNGQAWGGLYNPVTNRWTPTGLPSGMTGLTPEAAVWTGRDVVLAGTDYVHGRLGVAAYNPATGRWRMITPELPAGHPAGIVAMTATTSRLILWSMWNRAHGSGIPSGVDVLAMGTDGAWRDVTGRWPQHHLITAPSFTGSAILVSPAQYWCGATCSPPSTTFPGYFVNPVTLARTAIPAGPLGSLRPAFVWTGRAVMAVNEDTTIGTGSASSGGGTGSSHVTVGPGGTALFDPATRQWQSLSTPPGYPHLHAVFPAWAGNELLTLTQKGQLLALHR